MKYVVIKDDDTCFFTPVNILEALYGEILEKNVVNLSVIPNVYSSIKLDENEIYYKKDKLKYDPLISPEYSGSDRYYNVNDNPELIDFLNRKNVDVLQHGYAHEKINSMPEFSIRDREFVYKRAVEGKNILNKCVKRGISFFVPPWNIVSKEFISGSQLQYKGIITAGILPVYNNLNIFIPYYVNKLFKRRYYMYKNILLIDTYDLIQKYMDVSLIPGKFNSILNNNDIVIIQNHYWIFMNNWKKDDNMIEQWKSLYSKILDNNVRIISYNELFDMLKK